MLKKFYTSDFGKIITENTPSTQVNEYWNGEYCWITPSDLKDNKYLKIIKYTTTGKSIR